MCDRMNNEFIGSAPVSSVQKAAIWIWCIISIVSFPPPLQPCPGSLATVLPIWVVCATFVTGTWSFWKIIFFRIPQDNSLPHFLWLGVFKLCHHPHSDCLSLLMTSLKTPVKIIKHTLVENVPMVFSFVEVPPFFSRPFLSFLKMILVEPQVKSKVGVTLVNFHYVFVE